MTDFTNIHLLNNPKKGIAISRNVGLKGAKYPFVAFTDADCLVPMDWLSTLVRGFRKYCQIHPTLVAVGGSNTAPTEVSAFYDAVNIVLKTLLGNRGSTQGREFKNDRLVDHIPTLNILYLKQALDESGGFDENFRFVCEDPEMNYRLIKAGHKIMHMKDSSVIHAFKPGFRVWAEKIFTYGRGRTQLLLKHAGLFRFHYLIPPGIAILWITAPIMIISGDGPLWIWGAYVSLILLYTLFHISRSGYWKLYCHVLLLYFITHFSFGLGQLWGLILPIIKSKEP